MQNPVLYFIGHEPVVEFSARELKKYLRKATGKTYPIRRAKSYEPSTQGFWLGTYSEFPSTPAPRSSHPFDDEVFIKVGRKKGIISGSNPRSVLLAVYRFLCELGFRWVRPGIEGEVVPKLPTPFRPVTIHEIPSYRHRGVCIEGAVSLQHTVDMVDWITKLGMNAYFIQFREAYNFFQRWYEHEGNLYIKPESFSLEKARELTSSLVAEIKKRGLILHMVGHGWTCEPLGIPGTGWYQHQGTIPRRAKRLLAEVGGKRELWGGIAINTNLCYSNPEARRIITNAIVQYATEHPEVDIIHFWLADGSNNQCECPPCREDRPSDHYVRMLNELDGKLTSAGIDTRIVFLIYVDLLWHPLKEKIRNPDRFILMFAPITRSYSRSFGRKPSKVKLPPYRRNRLKFPSDPAVNLAFLQAWREAFDGDSFDFDYHFMWDHYKDPAQYSIADVLHQDIKNLRAIGLNGLISCQVQRAFFPTGYPMTVLARSLWDTGVDLDEVAEDYFDSAFGRRGREVRSYLKTLSEFFNPKLLRGEGTEHQKRSAPKKLAQIPSIIGDFLPLLSDGESRPVQASFKYLRRHAKFARLTAEALYELNSGNPEGAREKAEELAERVRRAEPSIHRALDVCLFLRVLLPLLGLSL